MGAAQLTRDFDQQRNRKLVCMLRPDAPLRCAWDVLLAVLCVYVAFVLPFTMGFYDLMNERTAKSLNQFELAIDLTFLWDVCLNFRTGFMERDGSVCLDGRRVAQNYLSSWFLLDLVSSLPMHELSAGRVEGIRPLKLLKIPKLFRAFRVMLLNFRRSKKLVDQSEITLILDDAFSTPLSRILLRRGGTLFSTLLLCHWLACLMGLCSTTWLTTYITARGSEPTLSRAYLVAAYWSVTTMSTLGWGDIVPSTDAELVFTIFAMTVGGFFYALTVGTLASIVSRNDVYVNAYHDRMDAVYAWIDYHHMPTHMRRRIIRYFKAYLRENNKAKDTEVVNQLSPALRDEVGHYVIHEDILHNPFFDGLPLNAVTRMQTILQKIYVEDGQAVVKEGEAGTAMFIVSKGAVSLQQADKDGEAKPRRLLFDGDSFGEEIMSGLQEFYSYTVTAVGGDASLFVIDEEDYDKIFVHMPDIKAQILQNVSNLHAAAARRSGERRNLAKAHSDPNEFGNSNSDVMIV